ncbi:MULTISPECIES: phosphodiesterase [Rhodococcus]|nr:MULTISPECIES: phosphodiesterase [Rhodococcus]MDV7242848.1 phosphodiesterase [Rhodococcus oxybenzonivorans]MDV7275252.1 phosphodiesterase [Rhodococcus oxybenzonivorans]MDV7334893.1 phosphodiesterase [Rhodococcus oxybenzonivorans]MDV7345047.1 phosphodiesterase [Rhodococcus oxybenzonivorans]MDV8029454.1 phosphodiesterase [Rhodococcus sp. IEGM 27]
MSQYGEPDHYILHVSDTHFVTDGALLHDCVDSDANLSRLFERLEKAGRRPEAIVFTGDLADRGEPEAYVRLRRIVEPAAERLGARVIWVMGNHDARPAFRSGLLDAEPTQDSVDAVVDVNGLRIIVLDSTVPGFHHGLISDEQLTWLTDVLAEPAPHGTLLALHHPPVPGLLDAIESVELKEQHRLETVLAGTDVRGILAGHLHYSTTCTFAGIPVSVASATCYTQDLLVDEGSIRGQDGAQGFNMVHVYRDRVLHTVVPLDGTPAVYEMTAEEIRQSIEQLTAPGV